jgi:hypothetical protein
MRGSDRNGARVLVTKFLLAVGPFWRWLPYRWRVALASRYVKWLMRAATPEELESFKAQARTERNTL